MKLLSAYQKHIPLTTYQEHHYHALTLSHPFLSVRSIDPFNYRRDRVITHTGD